MGGRVKPARQAVDIASALQFDHVERRFLDGEGHLQPRVARADHRQDADLVVRSRGCTGAGAVAGIGVRRLAGHRRGAEIYEAAIGRIEEAGGVLAAAGLLEEEAAAALGDAAVEPGIDDIGRDAAELDRPAAPGAEESLPDTAWLAGPSAASIAEASPEPVPAWASARAFSLASPRRARRCWSNGEATSCQPAEAAVADSARIIRPSSAARLPPPALRATLPCSLPLTRPSQRCRYEAHRARGRKTKQVRGHSLWSLRSRRSRARPSP